MLLYLDLLDFALFGPDETKKEGQDDNNMVCGTSQHVRLTSSHSSSVFCLHGIAKSKVDTGSKKCVCSSL